MSGGLDRGVLAGSPERDHFYSVCDWKSLMVASAHGEEVGGWVDEGACPSYLCWCFSGGGRAAGHLTPYPHFHSCGLPHFLCSVPLALCLALAGPFVIMWE